MQPKTRHQREELTITMNLNYGDGRSVSVIEMIRQCDQGKAHDQKVVTVTGFRDEMGGRIKRNVDLLPLGATIEEIQFAVSEAVGH